MIRAVTLHVKPKPKPRGQLGKYGNMTHSMGGYREWQQEIHKQLQLADFCTPSEFYAIVYEFGIIKARGGAPDVSNLVGGIEDALVSGGWLVDDNWKIIPRYYAIAKRSELPYIKLFFCTSSSELIHVINIESRTNASKR